MTLANQITILRILLVPAFIVVLLYYVHGGNESLRILALALFALAAVSDALDGFIARKYHQISELGTMLDPIADKMLLMAGFILLSLDNEPYLPSVPIWLTALVLSRDFLLVVGFMLIHYTLGDVTVKPHWTGKAATLLLMLIILSSIAKIGLGFLDTLFMAAGLCTAASAIIYLWAGIRQLAKHPASGPIRPDSKD